MRTILQPVTETVDFVFNGEPLLLPNKCARIADKIIDHQELTGESMKFKELCGHFKSTEEAMRQNISRIRAAIAHVDDKENPVLKLKCAKGFIGFEIKEKK